MWSGGIIGPFLFGNDVGQTETVIFGAKSLDGRTCHVFQKYILKILKFNYTLLVALWNFKTVHLTRNTFICTCAKGPI